MPLLALLDGDRRRGRRCAGRRSGPPPRRRVLRRGSRRLAMESLRASPVGGSDARRADARTTWRGRTPRRVRSEATGVSLRPRPCAGRVLRRCGRRGSSTIGAQDRRVRRDRGERGVARGRPPPAPSRRAASTPSRCRVAVAVEHVVDDLEHAARAPRRMRATASGRPRGTPATRSPSPTDAANSRPVLSRCSSARSSSAPVMSRYWPPIIPSVASASSQGRARASGSSSTSRNASTSRASPASSATPSPNAMCALGRPRRSSSSSSAGRSSWTSENAWTSSSAPAAGSAASGSAPAASAVARQMTARIRLPPSSA